MPDDKHQSRSRTESTQPLSPHPPSSPPDSPAFAHPSEEEFARILDFYGLQWEYEPRSFLLRWEGEQTKEMFTPDFYLSELDLYLELTTMKQSLVTKKNRKLRRLRELYPETNIKLLYRRDYHRLLAKYGFGPLAHANVEGVSRVLFTTDQIEKRVSELGRQISHDYRGRHPILVGVLRGVLLFMADLMREITLPVELEVMAVSSYQGETRGGVRVTKGLDADIAGRDVILVEDIIDSGMTLNYLTSYLESKQPASLEVCTFLDKKARRIVDVPVKYVGFDIPDEFVVGYGLDYEEKYRNLPFIGAIDSEKGS